MQRQETNSNTDLTAEFYARTNTPVPEQRRKVLERLDMLASEGQIADFAFHTWPNAVSLEDIEEGYVRDIVDTVGRIRDWASNRDVRIDPPFGRSSYHSHITGERDERLTVPHMALVVEGEDGIECAYPHHDGERTVTGEDGLALLREESDEGPQSKNQEADPIEPEQ
ncbi:MAG: HTH domain-containing protein [Halodesulfurarchaeum sp.]